MLPLMNGMPTPGVNAHRTDGFEVILQDPAADLVSSLK